MRRTFGMSRFAAPLLAFLAPFVWAACGPDATTSPTVPASSSASSSSSSSTSPAGATDSGANANANVKTLFVRETKVDCSGEGPRKCLQVRESEKDEWTLFYSSIEGFSYEEGTKYELRVATESVARPPQDTASVKYKLIEIVSKQKVGK
jgi:hypothetical protein